MNTWSQTKHGPQSTEHSHLHSKPLSLTVDQHVTDNWNFRWNLQTRHELFLLFYFRFVSFILYFAARELFYFLLFLFVFIFVFVYINDLYNYVFNCFLYYSWFV